ncbi:hypothetical protein RNZ50_21790 [Paracoccaceae bacterium Fryx2]|nr:hypothetical protein [Paracoccaceae bacterium Fryx2]
MKKTIKFPRFDAELNTDVCDAYNNADLTLTMKLGFTQINPAAGAASGTYHDYGKVTKPTRKIVKWTAGEWATWKANFVASAQAFWNGRFWLINDAGSFLQTVGTQTYVPNIFCKVKVTAHDGAAAGNHHKIDVVRLDSTETWFGSHSTLYDSLDTKSVSKGTDTAGNPIMQRAHVHEFGHLLGLGHVDEGKAHCPTTGNTNASACYGVADDDKNSVMGSGMTRRLEHAEPWRTVIRSFAVEEVLLLKKPAKSLYLPFHLMLLAPVTVFATWPAKDKRHYPRTPEEAKAGTLITTRPVRPA